MSAVVGCFNEKAKKLLELHLASGFKKYVMWFSNRRHKNHGQLIQQGKDLVTYAIINAVAMRKILKKYDKRTGAGIRLAVIETVLVQPFFTAEAVSLMVRECEAMMEAVFPTAPGEGQAAARRDREALVAAEQRKRSSALPCKGEN